MTAMSVPAGESPASAELLGELISLVRDTDRAARVAERDARRSEKNRVGMLYIHSMAAISIAPLFAVANIDTPAFTVMRMVPGAPYSTAALLGVGGIVLGMSAAGAHRRAAFTGLTLLALWYATMALTFAASAGTWTLAQHPESLTQALAFLVGDTPGKPSVYAVPLYAHLSAVMVRHMVTLRGKALDERALET